MTDSLPYQEANQLIQELRIRQSELEEKNHTLQRELEELKASSPNEPSVAESLLVGEGCHGKISSCMGMLRSVVDNIGDLIYIKDLNGVYRGCNKASEQFIGLTESEQIGKTDFDFFDQERAEEILDIDKQVTTSGIEHCVEEWASYPDGTKVLFESKKRPLYSAEGKIIGIVGISRDITSRKNTEEKFRDSEKRFRLLVENAPDAIITRNEKGCFTYLNKAAIALFGAASAQELIGTPSIERYHPNVRETLLSRMQIINEQRHAVPLLQTVCLQLNGKEVHVETAAVPMNYMSEDGALVFFRDITARVEEQKRHQQLEEQFHQSQKMESIGRLAGGVAHDINNMLSVILGNVELAKMKVERSVPVEEELEQILQAANRSKNITRQLLAFARKQVVKPKVLDLNTSLEGMLKMLRNLLGENIELCWHPKYKLWPVKIDPSQLDQVLANVCINARDAIADVGKMTIETNTAIFDENDCKDSQYLIPGEYTMFTVSDNGCGMDQEALDNIFEPFFTTKESGEGTGLGMATVYGIVKQNGGFINVYSEPDIGTTINIYLPRCVEEGVKEKEENTNAVQMGRGETVMLVEDEAAITELVKTNLESLGYIALATNSPKEAIALAESHRDEIHLLVTDVVMPEMNGRELAEKLRSTNPDMKILYMSGYSANVIAHHGVLDEGLNFIEKPFSREELSIRIREALDKET